MSGSWESLQAAYGVGESVCFTSGLNGLTKVVLSLPNGPRAELYLHGAHVTSFTVGSSDLLFMRRLTVISSKAKIDASSAIRGGIPVIFPQFGPGPLPQHGFARNSNDWSVDATKATIMEASITLRLDDNEATRAVWPHRFSLFLTVTITASPPTLVETINVVNRNESDPLCFTTVLHSYFAVGDVEKVFVGPLKGLTFTDKVRNGEKFQEKDDCLKIRGELDRVYEQAASTTTIFESGSPSISVIKDGFSDVVVWNIGEEKAPKVADLGEGEWKKYVCVEVGQIADPISLPHGHSWTAKQLIAQANDAARL